MSLPLRFECVRSNIVSFALLTISNDVACSRRLMTSVTRLGKYCFSSLKSLILVASKLPFHVIASNSKFSPFISTLQKLRHCMSLAQTLFTIALKELLFFFRCAFPASDDLDELCVASFPFSLSITLTPFLLQAPCVVLALATLYEFWSSCLQQPSSNLQHSLGYIVVPLPKSQPSQQ